MAKKLSTVIPPPPPAILENEPPDEGGGFEVYDGEDFPGLPVLNQYRETGDLQVLSDAVFNDWSWIIYRMRSADEMARERSKYQRIFITKLVGPLDLLELQRVCGGGVFEIRGFFGNRLRAQIRQEFAGAPRVYASAPAPVAPVASGNGYAMNPTPQSADPNLELRRMIRRQNRAIEQLNTLVQTRLVAPVSPAAPAPLQLADVFELADRMHARANPAPETKVVDEVVGAFRQGLALQREINGEPEKSATELVIDKGLPVVERLLGAFLASRGRPLARPLAPASSATVVDVTPPTGAPPPTPNPTTAVPDSGDYRWATAIEALARAVGEQQDPADFAITLEAILSPQEIGLVRMAGAAPVLAQLRERAGGQFPVLQTPAAEAFVASVVHSLNNPEDEPDELEDGEETGVPGV